MTMNFDDCIERAYSLLSGNAELPPDAEPGFRRALDGWRDLWPSRTAPLRVVSRPQEIASTLPVRPLLVKLHGSLGRHAEGLTLSMPPMTDEPDPGDMGSARSDAFDALAAEGFVLVIGFSATDLASRSALLGRLVPGRFWWVAAAIEADVRRRVAAIDQSQPMIGEPLDALRMMPRIELPAWPRARAPGPTFDSHLDGWAETLAPEVAAEALAWALADAGHVEVSIEILRRLVRAGAGARTRVRLADALARRRRPGDVRAARRTFMRAACSWPDQCSGPDRGLRSYALARWFESVGTGPDAAPAMVARPLAGAALVATVAVSAAGRNRLAPDVPGPGCDRCLRDDAHDTGARPVRHSCGHPRSSARRSVRSRPQQRRRSGSSTRGPMLRPVGVEQCWSVRSSSSRRSAHCCETNRRQSRRSCRCADCPRYFSTSRIARAKQIRQAPEPSSRSQLTTSRRPSGPSMRRGSLAWNPSESSLWRNDC